VSDKIRGRVSGPPPSEPAPDATAVKPEAKVVRAPLPSAKPTVPPPARGDLFERSSGVGAQIESRLQPLANKSQAAKVHFSSQDLEALANTFASILSENPQADRLKRARLFAAAILRRKRLKKLFAGVADQEMEQMCDIIGDVLDSSPVFGQLVDNVTQDASK
jgi:hypothetical protein